MKRFDTDRALSVEHGKLHHWVLYRHFEEFSLKRPDIRFWHIRARLDTLETSMPKAQSVSRQEQLQSLLRLLRSEAALTQTDVAQRLHQPQSFISKYESGERRLDILELRDVCDALGIDLAHFVMRLEAMLK